MSGGVALVVAGLLVGWAGGYDRVSPALVFLLGVVGVLAGLGLLIFATV